MGNTAFFARHGLNVQNVFIANTTQVGFGANVILTLSSLSFGNSTVNSAINTTSFFAGNSTANINLGVALLKIANTTGSANLDPVKLIIGISTVNSIALSVGANMAITATAISIGNTTVNAFANSLIVQLGNATGVANLTPLSLQLAANVLLDTVKLSIGNSTVNTIANSVIHTIRDATKTTNVTSDGLVVGTTTVNTAGFFGAGGGLTGIVPSPAGATTQVQFNDAGVTNAVAGFTFTKSTNNVSVANNITALTYDTSSDVRLKNVHKELTDFKAHSVMHIPVWEYTLKSDPEHVKIGLLAQDVQGYIPNAVKANDEGFLSINFDMITSAMLACMKQLEKRIEELELEIG